MGSSSVLISMAAVSELPLKSTLRRNNFSSSELPMRFSERKVKASESEIAKQIASSSSVYENSHAIDWFYCAISIYEIVSILAIIDVGLQLHALHSAPLQHTNRSSIVPLQPQPIVTEKNIKEQWKEGTGRPTQCHERTITIDHWEHSEHHVE